VEPTNKEFDPEGFWHIKGMRSLNPRSQAILRELYLYRDRRARALKRPPFKVMTDSVLITIARINPTSLKDLDRVKGLSRNMRQREGRRILETVARGRRARPPKYSRRRRQSRGKRPDEATMTRYETLRDWRKNVAKERGVEPDVVLSNDTLMAIARKDPATLQTLEALDVLGDWQLEKYGPSLLKTLESLRD
jgi:ribonuclease D